MTLKAKLMMFTAAVAFSATMASAAITANDVVATYQSQGYSYVQVKDGISQIKVEAIKDGVKLEVIYDKASGNVIRQESGAADASEATRSGVEVQQTNRDFDDNGGNGNDDNLVAHNSASENGASENGASENGASENGASENHDGSESNDGAENGEADS